MLAKREPRAPETAPPTAVAIESEELRAAARRQVKRVRRRKINVAAWAFGTILVTTLWVLTEWQDNGALKSFGHEGEPGQWNPTLWALAVGIWGLAVGIMALRVHFERPATAAEVDRGAEELKPRVTVMGAMTAAELRRFARRRLERVRRLKFHVAAWMLGMLVLTPLWALIEWQDNGGFERWSNNSRPGDWEPWILYVGGVWALVVATLALHAYLERPATEAEIDRELERLHSGG
jgi:hypothetical protein